VVLQQMDQENNIIMQENRAALETLSEVPLVISKKMILKLILLQDMIRMVSQIYDIITFI